MKRYIYIIALYAVTFLVTVCTADKLAFPKALKNTIEKDMKYWTNSCQQSTALLCEAFSTDTVSNRIELIQKANNLLSYKNPSHLLRLKDLRRFKVRNKNPDALASYFDLSILDDEEE